MGDLYVIAAVLIVCLFLVWKSWHSGWLSMAVFKPNDADDSEQDTQAVTLAQNSNTDQQSSWEEITEGIGWDGENHRVRVDKSILRNQHVRKNDDDNQLRYEFMFNFHKAYEITKELTDVHLQSLTIGENILSIQCNRISCFEITNEADAYVIQYVSPRDMYKKIVFLDVGHGGEDYGAIVGDIAEKDINMDYATRVYGLFEADIENDIKIYMTRMDDSFLTPEERVNKSEGIADVFISIHNNTDGAGGKTAHGTETYFQSSHSSTHAKSKSIAEIMQKRVSQSVQTRDRGIISNDTYYILNHSKVPTVLIEVGFMTTPAELERLLDNDFAQKVAEGIAGGIREIFDEGIVEGRRGKADSRER